MGAGFMQSHESAKQQLAPVWRQTKGEGPAWEQAEQTVRSSYGDDVFMVAVHTLQLDANRKHK